MNSSYRKIENSKLYKGVTKVAKVNATDRRSKAFKEEDMSWKAKVIKDSKHYIALLPTEREAALWVDKKRIELGLQPQNILKIKK